jgi:hypothetical protein
MARTLWLVVLGAVIGAVVLVGRPQRDADSPDAPTTPPKARADTQDIARAANEVTARAPAEAGVREPEPKLPPAVTEASDSTLQRFLDVRGISLAAGAQKDFLEFIADPRDPAWAPGMEARFQSELAKGTRTLTESYVECRRTRCLVLLVEPPGVQRDAKAAFTRADFDEQVATASSLNLFGIGTFAASTRDGALVRWQRYFRRCGPDWNCLPQPSE